MKGWFGLLTSNLVHHKIVKSLNVCTWNTSDLTQDTYAKVQPHFIIPHQCCRIETVLFPSAKTWAALCMNWGVTQCIWKTLNWNIEMKLAKFEQLSRITALDLGVYVFCASPNFGKSLWLCWCCGMCKCLPASASLKLNLGTYHLPFLPGYGLQPKNIQAYKREDSGIKFQQVP